MSETDGPGQEPDFDDPSYADLRGLLADAREDAPMPADVLARLERTLSGLVAEREEAAESPDTVVVPLRRRSWAPRLLGAAAAVVLIGGVGIGLNQVSDHSGSDDKAASATGSDSSAVAPAPELAASAGADPTPLSGALLDTQGRALKLKGRLSSFTRAGFDRQVARYVAAAQNLSLAYGTVVPASPQQGAADQSNTGGTATGSGSVTSGSDAGGGVPAPDADAPAGAASGAGGAAGSPDSLAAKSNTLLRDFSSLRSTPSCPGPHPTDGALVLRIRFAGEPATLVLHPVVKGSQFVAAWSCDGTELLAATTVRP